jgi:hypothetical protein
MSDLQTNIDPERREYLFTRDPKTMSPAELQREMNKPATTYDQELDNPVIHDPAMAADLERMSKEYLTPTNQNVEEMLLQFETNYCDERTRQQRWPGQERWMGKDAEAMRLVKILHPYEFLRRLRSAGVDARAEEHRNARIWLNDWSRVGRIGVNARIAGEVKTVSSLQYPYGPEYSLMRFNHYDVPTEERYRGWRTVLLALIVTGVVTEKEAEEAFGPAVGPASEFYREQLQVSRRIKMGLQI